MYRDDLLVFQQSVGGTGTIAMYNRSSPFACSLVSHCEALHWLSANACRCTHVYGKTRSCLALFVQLHR